MFNKVIEYFRKLFSKEFDEILLTLRDQNGRPLETEDKVNLTLIIHE